MKSTIKISTVLICLFLGYSLLAQSNTKDDDKKPKKKEYRVPIYLGKSDRSGGDISVKLFDSLLSQGLTSRDTLGRPHLVSGFTFTYAERNLYEDEVGNLMWLTDFLAEYCEGDTLQSYVLDNIKDRSKVGDTVYFDNITVFSPDSVGYNGKGMMFVLTK